MNNLFWSHHETRNHNNDYYNSVGRTRDCRRGRDVVNLPTIRTATASMVIIVLVSMSMLVPCTVVPMWMWRPIGPRGREIIRTSIATTMTDGRTVFKCYLRCEWQRKDVNERQHSVTLSTRMWLQPPVQLSDSEADARNISEPMDDDIDNMLTDDHGKPTDAGYVLAQWGQNGCIAYDHD